MREPQTRRESRRYYVYYLRQERYIHSVYSKIFLEINSNQIEILESNRDLPNVVNPRAGGVPIVNDRKNVSVRITHLGYLIIK